MQTLRKNQVHGEKTPSRDKVNHRFTSPPSFNNTSGNKKNNSQKLLADKNNAPSQFYDHPTLLESDYISDDYSESNAEYLEFSDSADLTPPSDFLLDKPRLETKGTEQKKRAAKKEPEYRLQQLINIAIKEKCKHLGVEYLSAIQTDIVEKTEQINYKPKKREWLRLPSKEYLEMRESKQYKTAYRIMKKALDSGKNEATINQRYALPSHVAAYDLGIDILKSWQDMNTGKSFSHGWMMDFHPAMQNGLSLCHLEAINLSNATARNNDSKARFNNDQETNAIYHDVKKGINIDLINVHSTWQGEHQVKKQKGVEGYSLTLIDESEGAAGFISSGVIKNRWEVIQSLRSTIKHNDFTIFTDAHAGRKTQELIEILTDKPVFTIKNTCKVWSHVNGYVIDEFENGLLDNRKELRKAMEKGFKVGSFFASAEDAKYAQSETKRLLNLTDDQYPLITSKTGERELVKKLKKNPKLFKNLVGFCASPSLGIGISIEVKEYLTTYLFASDGDMVGDSESQTQMLFRLRHVKSIILVRCHDKTMGESKLNNLKAEFLDGARKQAIADVILQSAINDNSEIAKLRYEAQTDLYQYDREIRMIYIADVLNRFENIEKLLTDKGIKLVDIYYEKVEDGLKIATIIQKKELKKAELKRLAEIEVISTEEAKELVIEKKKNNNKLSEEKRDKLKIYNVSKNFNRIDDDSKNVTVMAIGDYENGMVKKRDNLQQAMATKRQITTITKALAFGVKDGKKTKLQADLADTSPEKMLIDYEHDKYLVSLLDIGTDENGYVSSIGGIVDIDNMHERSKKKIVATINNSVEKRNSLKLNGMLESRINGYEEISQQVKIKMQGRLGLWFKARSKTPLLVVEKKSTPKAFYLEILREVFGGRGKKRINSKQVSTVDVLKTEFTSLLTDKLIDKANKANALIEREDKKGKPLKPYEITKAKAKRSPLKTLEILLELAGVAYGEAKRKNGYKVASRECDAQHLADVAREKEINKTANLLAYIESIGKLKN
jgi:hypothetical protein